MRQIFCGASGALLLSAVCCLGGYAQDSVRKVTVSDEWFEAYMALTRAAKDKPDDMQLSAWQVVLHAGEKNNFLDPAQMKEKQPDSPWTLIVEASQQPDAVMASKLCDAALSKTVNDPDLLVMATRILVEKTRSGKHIEEAKAFLQKYREASAANADTLLAWVNAREKLGEQILPDELLLICDHAIQLDGNSYGAMLLKSSALERKGKTQDAYHLMRQTAHQFPASQHVHVALWNMILTLPGMTVEEQKAAILEDARVYFTAGKPNTWLIDKFFEHHAQDAPEVAKAIAESVAEHYPNTELEDEALLAIAQLDFPNSSPEENAEAKIVALERFIDRPHHANPRSLIRANSMLLQFLEAQKQPDLNRLYQCMTALGTDPRALLILADHQYKLPELENLSNAYLESIRKKSAGTGAADMSADAAKEARTALEQSTGTALEALGWIEFEQHKTAEAAEKLKRAHQMIPEDAGCLVRLGRIAVAQKQFDKAERMYRDALSLPYDGNDDHVAIAALRTLYTEIHGGSSGLESYIKPLLEQDKLRRKTVVLATRIVSPAAVKAFHLQTLDGKYVDSESLKGRIVVMNYWATWCSSCVRELPDLEKLYQSYRNDPSVVIVAVDTDDPGTSDKTIQRFLLTHRITVPVVRGSEYASSQGVTLLPHTWFLDTDARLSFQNSGYSDHLAEEFSWKIEAMRRAVNGKDTADALARQ